MKKNKLIYLVVLMSISLLGIIAVQLLFVNTIIHAQTEKFNATVYDALNQAIHKIQREQAANFFLNRYAPHRSQSISTDTTKNSVSYMVPYFPSTSKYHQKMKPEGMNLNIQKKQGGGIFSAKVQISENGVSRQYTISNENIDLNDSESIKQIENIIDNINDSINKVVENIQDGGMDAMTIFNQFNYELHMQKADKRSLIDPVNLQKALKYSLKSRGIDLNFEYGIFGDRTPQNMAFKSKDYTSEDSDKMYSCYLFPDNLMSHSNNLILDLYFPHKEQFIVKSISILLGSSVLFTIFIIITFYFTFKTIVNQKKVSEIKSDFINNMTHELKTPIATINLAADNIANPIILEKPEHIKPFIKIIKEENQRMNKQVERVLQMSLIEKKDFQLMPISVDIHELIHEATNKISLLVEEKNGHIQTHLNADFTVCLVDEVHITNVLLNLLENAIKYSDSVPIIDIETRNNKNGIEISVTDKGIGMSKEQQAKAFDKFFRATKGNIHNVKGFGLGLSYVKAIMLQHKGDITVKSKLGEGSTFTLFLPQN